MKNKQQEMTVTGVIVDETVSLTVAEICRKYTISETTLYELAEHGLFHSKIRIEKTTQLDATALQRLQSALRLQHDLGVNAPGAVLAVELSEELEHLRQELAFLRRNKII